MVSVAEKGGVAGFLIFRGVVRPQYAESAELAVRKLRNCLLVLGGGLVRDWLRLELLGQRRATYTITLLTAAADNTHYFSQEWSVLIVPPRE